MFTQRRYLRIEARLESLPLVGSSAVIALDLLKPTELLVNELMHARDEQSEKTNRQRKEVARFAGSMLVKSIYTEQFHSAIDQADIFTELMEDMPSQTEIVDVVDDIGKAEDLRIFLKELESIRN